MPSNPGEISSTSDLRRMFWFLAGITLLSIFVGIAANLYVLAGLPAFLLLAYVTVVDFRKTFFLLLGLLPLSTEVYLPNGLGTDLPAEPLMVLLMGVFLLYLLKHFSALDAGFYRHPITLLLFLHLGWILITSITSANPLVSFKFLAAKLWYVCTFYFLAGILVRRQEDFQKVFWWVFIPLIGTTVYVIVRHAGYSFAFADINQVMNPFYRNHVNYACILALFFPFIWFARFWYRRGQFTRLVLFGSVLWFLLAIQLSYTRAAYVGLVIAFGAYFVIKMKLVRVVLLLALAFLIGVVGFFVQDDHYLEYAPNYKKTVTHYKFDNLLEATAKGEDISTMERVYRWVAGMYMNRERPWMGFGPGNFYNFYRSYTVTSFETYVSDNPEKSGIHSYYLMTLVEQGFPGLAIFLLLTAVVLIIGERVYHETEDPMARRKVMAVLLSLIIIDALLLINDMIETDKVGPFFFISIAILVNQDLENKRRLSSPKEVDVEV